ncbi:MAG: GNAT family N-acetyltransferase [Lachnospiraceae bacterium]|nr:GNAT family N-acetyltransferase [Lachnospiraceae bacterium]
MRFDEKKITLKDGRVCILRPAEPEPETAQALIDYMVQTAEETPFLLRYPDEIHYTIESEIAFLEHAAGDPRIIMMTAAVDGEVAGCASVNPVGGVRRVLHRGSLAIALKKKYWDLGIGTAMIAYLSGLAQEAGYEQLELGVIEGNDRAKMLYEKCGFAEMGNQVDAIRYDDGTYADEILMILKLTGQK